MALWHRFFGIHKKRQDLQDEIDAHLAMEIRERIEHGESADDARLNALHDFGNVNLVKAATRDTWGWVRLEQWLQDVRYAVRSLARRPGFATIAILSLALGIGANTAIFSVVNSVLLRPLPYKDADRLVVIWAALDQSPDKAFASYGDYQQIRNHGRAFEDAAALTWARAGQTLTWRGEAHRVLSIPVTENFFTLLGAEPILGRSFSTADLSNGCTIVVAHGFWKASLGATPDALNTNLTLDGESCTVIGVMSDKFQFFPKQTEIWKLITSDMQIALDPKNSVAIVARLKRGVTRSAAEAEAVQLHNEVTREAPASSWVRHMTPHVYDLQGEFAFLAGPNLRLGLVTLFAAVGMVLLIACVNIAGLLLSRGAERQKELALRAALGSGRARIVQQLLMESIVLASVGAAIGAGIAVLGVQYFHAINPIDLPPGNPVSVNRDVLAFTALLGLLSGVLSGLAPALKMSRTDLNDVLKGTAQSVASNWLNTSSGKILIVAEVALSMVLLIGATLFIESIHRLTNLPLGLRTDHLWTAHLYLPPKDYNDVAKRFRFYDSVGINLAGLPGIEAVALSSNKPLTGFNTTAVTIAGKPAPASEIGDIDIEQVSNNFMTVMGVPLLRGRQFGFGDHETTQQVAIVNQKFMDEYFPNEDVIGKQIRVGPPNTNTPWLTIVGLSGNVERGDFFREMGYRVTPIVYRPISQSSGTGMTVVLRTTVQSQNIAGFVRAELARMDNRVPVDDVDTLDSLISKNFSQPRFRTLLLGTFAALALVLAALGLYGVLTHAVLQRTREIGIRMALGAEQRHVFMTVGAQGVTLTAIGAIAGILAASLLTRFIRSMLFGVTPTDTRTLIIAAAILVSVSLIATYLPARRAARVDPLLTLKHE